MRNFSNRSPLSFLLILSVLLWQFYALPISAFSPTEAELKASIADLSSKLSAAQAKIALLGTSQNSLINKLRSTNAGKFPLLVMGVMASSPGSSFQVPITFITAPQQLVALQQDMVIPNGFTMESIAPGPAATNAGKSVVMNTVNGITRLIVFGINQIPITSGTLAIATFKVSTDVPKGFYSLGMINPVASDANGNSVAICSTSGKVQIQ